MAKSRRKKTDNPSKSVKGHYGYCSACDSYRKINGVCKTCGATDVSPDEKTIPDRTSENNPAQ